MEVKSANIGKWKLATKYSFFRTDISVKTEIDMTLPPSPPPPLLAYVHILMTSTLPY